MAHVPLFLYAVAFARAGSVEMEGRPEIARAGRYGLQRLMILVPFFVVVLFLPQERTRRGTKAGSARRDQNVEPGGPLDGYR